MRDKPLKAYFMAKLDPGSRRYRALYQTPQFREAELTDQFGRPILFPSPQDAEIAGARALCAKLNAAQSPQKAVRRPGRPLGTGPRQKSESRPQTAREAAEALFAKPKEKGG